MSKAQYVILNGKTPTHEFKDGVGAMTWDEVKDFDNVAVIVPKGYVVLDFDTTSDAEIMLKIVDGLGLKCKVLKTTRGIHCWFKSPEDSPKNFIKNRLAIGIFCDRKAGGRNAYVKIKQDGKKREWIRQAKSEDIQVVPKWLTSISAPSGKFDFKGMGEGSGRNQELYNYIVYLQTKGFSRDEIRETIEIINNYVFDEPLPDSEIGTICRDEAFKSDEEISNQTKKTTFDHVVIGEEIIEKYRLISYHDVIYEYSDGYYQPAEFLEKYIRTAYVGARINQVNEVLRYIKSMKKIRPEDIKTDPYIINLTNTRLNIKTGEHLGFTPDVISFQSIPVKYNPNAKCAALDNMLLKVFCDDHELVKLFDEMMGYILLKNSPFETAFILYGDGSNGKSTILSLIKKFLGSSNYSCIPLELLSSRFYTAELEHKLANIGDDTNDVVIRDNGTLKQLISGQAIQVERKGKQPFDMVSYATQIFACNEIPKSVDCSQGFYRRLMFIPFNAVFTSDDEDYDPFIVDKITTDEAMSHLLNRAIEGVQRILKNKGFTQPEVSKKLKEEHKINNSYTLAWIDEEGIDLKYILSKERKDVYSDFSDWCRVSNIKNITGKQYFFKELRRKFGLDEKPKESNGKRYFKKSAI